MAHTYRCEECGAELTGEDAGAVATDAATHAREEHNEPLSREHILAALQGEEPGAEPGLS